MARAHLYRPVQDAQGNLRTGAVVRVFKPDAAEVTDVTLYRAGTGTATLPPVHTAASGIIDFYTDEPQRFRIGIKVGDEPEVVFENVDVLEPSLPMDTPVAQPGGATSNQVALTQVSTSTTLTDNDSVVFLDGVDLTVTLPTPSGRVGRQFIIKNLNETGLTIGTAAGLIDGDVTRVLAQYDALTIISNGTNWSVV